jgi:hypothetical protein
MAPASRTPSTPTDNYILAGSTYEASTRGLVEFTATRPRRLEAMHRKPERAGFRDFIIWPK